MRRRWAKPRGQSGRLAVRDQAIILLLGHGFTAGEVADAFDLCRKHAARLVGRLEGLRGGPIAAEPGLVAEADRVAGRLGIARGTGPVSARDRVEAALADRPGATLDELSEAAGVSPSWAYRVLGPRAPVKSHARCAEERAGRRPRIVAALRESPGESWTSIAQRIDVPWHEVRAVAKELGLPTPYQPIRLILPTPDFR